MFYSTRLLHFIKRTNFQKFPTNIFIVLIFKLFKTMAQLDLMSTIPNSLPLDLFLSTLSDEEKQNFVAISEILNELDIF